MSDSIIGKKSEKEKATFKPVSEERFKRQSQTVHDHTGSVFLLVRIDHIHYFKGDCDAAVVLAYVLNQFKLKTRSIKGQESLTRRGLWFKMPFGVTRKSLNMGEDRLRRSLAVLEKSEVLSTAKRSGHFNWVQINDEKLREIEATHKRFQIRGNPVTGNPGYGETQYPRDTGKPSIPINKKGKEETGDPPASNGFFEEGKKGSHPRWTSLAEKLKQALRRNGRVCRGTINNSAEQLRLCREEDNQKDVERLVVAYCKVCSVVDCDRYGLPDIENGKQFRHQINWIRRSLNKHRLIEPEGAPLPKQTVKRQVLPNGNILYSEIEGEGR